MQRGPGGGPGRTVRALRHRARGRCVRVAAPRRRRPHRRGRAALAGGRGRGGGGAQRGGPAAEERAHAAAAAAARGGGRQGGPVSGGPAGAGCTGHPLRAPLTSAAPPPARAARAAPRAAGRAPRRRSPSRARGTCAKPPRRPPRCRRCAWCTRTRASWSWRAREELDQPIWRPLRTWWCSRWARWTCVCAPRRRGGGICGAHRAGARHAPRARWRQEAGGPRAAGPGRLRCQGPAPAAPRALFPWAQRPPFCCAAAGVLCF
jgi:hypothetical protein